MDAGGIQDFQFLAIDRQVGSYQIDYTIVVNGEKQRLSLYVSDAGIESFIGEGSYIDEPVAHFGQWKEYLWQYYEGCYFDPETGQYIYNN